MKQSNPKVTFKHFEDSLPTASVYQVRICPVSSLDLLANELSLSHFFVGTLLDGGPFWTEACATARDAKERIKPGLWIASTTATPWRRDCPHHVLSGPGQRWQRSVGGPRPQPWTVYFRWMTDEGHLQSMWADCACPNWLVYYNTKWDVFWDLWKTNLFV